MRQHLLHVAPDPARLRFEQVGAAGVELDLDLDHGRVTVGTELGPWRQRDRTATGSQSPAVGAGGQFDAVAEVAT